MIVVDSSVLISHLSNVLHPEVVHLRQLDEPETILIGDVVVLEVLKGLRSDKVVRLVESRLAEFSQVSMLDGEMARHAAANYRKLRALGITVRSSIDLVIGTYCAMHGHQLLHRDRDFDHFERHLGLKVLH